MPGSPPAPEVAVLYAVCWKANRPMTYLDMADEWYPTAAGYIGAAMRGYREHKLDTDPTWLDGKGERWGDDAMREAFRWWVGALLQGSARTYLTPEPGRRKPQLYRVNPDRPPRVVVQRTTERIARWTPEYQDLGAAHMAGVRFLAAADQVKAAIKDPKLRALVDDAERALQAKPKPL